MLDAGIAGRALELSDSYITKLYSSKVTKRGDLHIVVARRVAGKPDPEVFANRSYGTPKLWEHPYHTIAYGKATITNRTGLSSREVQLLHPALLEVTDVIYWGSVIRDGIIVAVSGVQPWFDETIANVVLATVHGLITDRVMSLRDTVSGDFYNS